MYPSRLLTPLAVVQMATVLLGVHVAHAMSTAPTRRPAVAVAVTIVSTQPPHVLAAPPARARVIAKAHATPKAHPSPKAHPTPRASKAAAPVPAQPRPRLVPTPQVVTRAPLTAEARMWQAIRRLPGYLPDEAIWTLTPGQDAWGLTNLQAAVVNISSRVPANRMYDVVAHEWGHVQSMHAYGYDVATALIALNRLYGGPGSGAERAADCIARVLGAQWTNYTPCDNASWRAGARRLLAGQRL